MLENVKLAFEGVRTHKLRSLLTMLGIIIGIASIITIVSTIKGTNEQIKQNLIGNGNNVVVVRVYQNDYAYDFTYQSAPDCIKVIEPDALDEINKLRGVAESSLFHQREYTESVFYMDTAFNGKLLGIDDNYLSVYGYKLCYGRMPIQSDYDNARKIILLDTKAVTTLFAGDNPIGKTVELKGAPYTVVGVVEQSSNELSINSISDYYTYAENGSGSMFIPDSTWPIVYQFDEPQCVAVRASSTDSMTNAGKNTADYLTENQIIGTDTGYSYRSENLLEQAQQLQDLSGSTSRQLIWIASISLLVGGIGVMNIMLVSVTERTSEIGLKKAIGAKKKRILWQFLTEAAVLTSFGGIIGVIAGVIMATLISQIMGTPSAISFAAVLIAVVFSTVIGVVFGIIPAMKAANLSPIEALRRE